MSFCIVHDSQDDYDSRGPDDFLPTLEDLEHELYVHLLGVMGLADRCSVDYCGHCYEEFLIRQNGIEDVMVEEAFMDKYIEEECTCPEGSPNRMYFLQQIRHSNRKVTA